MNRYLKLLYVLLLPHFLYSQNEAFLVINPQGHSARINAICPIGKSGYFITGSDDKTINLWHASSNKLIQTFRPTMGTGNEGQLHCADVSSDGNYLAFSGNPVDFSKNGNYITILNISKGEICCVLKGHSNSVNSLCFSSDNKTLVSASKDKTIKIWDISEIEKKSLFLKTKPIQSLTGHTQEINKIRFLEKNKIISVSSDSTLKIWTLGKDSFTLTSNISYHQSEVLSLAESPDGKNFLTGGLNGYVYLWDSNGKPIRQLDLLANSVTALDISPDGKKAVVVSGSFPEKNAYVFNLSDGRKTAVFSGHNNTVKAVAFLNDSTVISSSESLIYIWNAKTGKLISVIKGKGSRVYSVASGKNGRVALGNSLFTGDIDNINKNPLEKIFSFSDFFLKENFVDETQYRKASVDNSGQLIQASCNELKYGEIKIVPLPTDGDIRCYTLTPDSNIVVGFDFSLKEFNPQGIIVREYSGHAATVRALSASVDGKMLLSCGDDQTIRFWTRERNPVRFKLTTVRSGGLAERSGLQKGDVITGIDSNIYYSEPELNPTIKEKKEYIFHLIREGKEMDLKVNKTENAFGFSRVPVFDNLLATLFVTDDNEWICWTPSGYFAASPNGDKYMGWQINRGIDSLALFYNAGQFFEKYYRPDWVKRVLTSCKTDSYYLRMQKEKGGDVAMLRAVPDVKISLKGNEQSQRGLKLDTEPEPESIHPFASAEVTVTASDKGSGLSEIRLYLNDKLIETARLTSDSLNTANATYTRTFVVDLVDGDNIIRASAFNSDRTEAFSNEISLKWKETKTDADLYLFCIGINEYENQSYRLNYALPDAISFYDELKAGANEIFTNIHTYFLKDLHAKKDSVLNVFKSIAAQAQPRDVLVLYYAGHGVMSEGTGGKKPQFFIVPSDVTQLYGRDDILEQKAVSAADLMEFSKNVKAQKQLFVFDACQSGGAVEAFTGRGVSKEKAIIQLARSTGMTLLAAAGSQQFATEFTEIGHGVFTFAILEALKGKADGGDKDQKITVKELSYFLEDRVPQLTQKYRGEAQYPTGFSTGQDFPIVIIK